VEKATLPLCPFLIFASPSTDLRDETSTVTSVAGCSCLPVFIVALDNFSPAAAGETGLLPSVANVVAVPPVPDPMEYFPSVGDQVVGFDHQFLSSPDDIEGSQIIFAVKQA
jgi:hypothetical protein